MRALKPLRSTSLRALQVGKKTILPPSSAQASMMQGFGPPAVLLSATLDHSATLVWTDERMYGTTLTVGHQCDFSTTPRMPIASALGSQRNSGSRLRSLAENSKSIWQWTSIAPATCRRRESCSLLRRINHKDHIGHNVEESESDNYRKERKVRKRRP